MHPELDEPRTSSRVKGWMSTLPGGFITTALKAAPEPKPLKRKNQKKGNGNNGNGGVDYQDASNTINV